MTEPCPKVSVLLPTFNSQALVRDCLESVKWADEILVVDSFSTDHTLDVCREYAARIVQHEYIQSAKQKNWAIPQCAHDWVLQIDTDERMEPGSEEEIKNVIAQADAETVVFRIPRKNHVLNQWVQVAGLYPDYQTRLFRKNVAFFEDREVHAHVRVPGNYGTLQHHIVHYGMQSISKQLGNLDRYTRYHADELKKRGKHFHWYQLLFRPFAIFVYFYFRKRGFTAGYRGLIISAYNATFDFWAHAKLWELESQGWQASPK